MSAPDAIPHFDGVVPWLTTEQMILVDRAMVHEARILLIQMMENAGRNLAHLARVRFLHGDPRGRFVTILAGTGGNGGGALVCARHLSSWGARVRVVLATDDERLHVVPRHQLDAVRRIGVGVARASSLSADAPDLIVDGVLGYGLTGDPKGEFAEMIRWANASTAPTVSLDIPSGLDASTGRASRPAVRAAATMTLALPKEGLRGETARDFVGELYVADVGVPPLLYASVLGLDIPPLFYRGDVVRLYAGACLQAGHVDSALATLQYSAATYPHSANVWDSLADALERAGKVDEALASAQKAATTGRENGDPNVEAYRRHVARLESVVTPGAR